MRISQKFLKAFLVSWIMWGISIPCESDARLVLRIDSECDTLVIGEPVKIIAVLSNTSNRSERFIGFDKFQRAIYFEVLPPIGSKERRYSSHPGSSTTCGPDNPKKEKLYYGYSVVASFYPNITWRRRGDYGSLTFTHPGPYKIRLVYQVKDSSESPLYSNWITLVFNSPTEQQKEILDAYWGGGNHFFGMFMFGLPWPERGSSREQALRKLIMKYPDIDYVKYAYFALLGVLNFPTPFEKPGPVDEVEEIGDFLMSTYPDFNFVDVRLLVARCFRENSKSSEALQLYKECFLKDPRIAQDAYFVFSVLKARGDYNGYWHWKRKRRLKIIRGITIEDF